jgi:D-serine deaminase-like pyridoxal phosphate-dependent protein
MTQQHSLIGSSKWDIDTPALLIDLPAMESNLAKMAKFFEGVPANLRPHVKTYKATPELARLQLNAGAVGVTCAKVSEAEVLVRAGIEDVLIANQIVTPLKIARLIELAKVSDIKVAVDNAVNVAALSQMASKGRAEIGVLVEVNIGHNRCGVAPFGPTLELVQLVIDSPGLKFRGLMGYDGHCTLKITAEERGGEAKKANSLLVEVKEFIQAAGIEVGIVSASGTFTYRYAAPIEGITEIQAGTYLLMDTAFRDHGVTEFEQALSVLATVTSCPTYPGAEGLAIIDVGRKSISPLLGNPEVKHPAGAEVTSLSQEHGRIVFEGGVRSVTIGEKVELQVRDSNGTVLLFDRFYAIRDGIVEAVWPIPLCGVST